MPILRWNKNVTTFFCCDEKSLQQTKDEASSLTASSNDQVWQIISFDGAVCELASF